MVATDFLSTSGSINVDKRFEFAKGLAEEDHNLAAAIDLLEQTRALASDWPVLHFTLGKYYKLSGQHERAIENFKHSKILDPQDRQGAALELERLGISSITENMPPAFVETLFDQYAQHFEKHLVEILEYTVPEKIAEIARQYYNSNNLAHILDLGCGTGLAGTHLKTFAASLTGVDLSNGMLDQTREKNIYDELVQSELVLYLQSTENLYPLIVAADVLIYFGALDSVFHSIKKRLAKNGHFIFSVQALCDPPQDCLQPDFYLDRTRRFSHSKIYLENSISAAGLHLINVQSVILRKDEGKNVHGYLAICTH